jgi:C4-dicarboxylate-specific signal transduction histidine kinase
MRLAAVVLVAAVPAISLLVLLRHELTLEIERRVEAETMLAARVSGNDLRGAIEQTRQLSAVLNDTKAVHTAAPDCHGLLAAMRHHLSDVAPAISYVAVVASDLRVACLAPSGTTPSAEPVQRAARAALGRAGPVMEGYVGGKDGEGRFLSIGLPVRDAQGGVEGVLITALGLDWIGSHLLANGNSSYAVALTDRNGVVLMRSPSMNDAGPLLLPEERETSGARIVTAADGRRHAVATMLIPFGQDQLALTLASPAAAISARTQAVISQGYTATGLAEGAALLIAFLFGCRYICRPIQALLAAARDWEQGNLSRRVMRAEGSGTEFGRLASAFNLMANSLSRQHAELERLKVTLEARVAERTMALLQSNNRLQVEVSERERTEANLHQAQKLQAVGQLAGGLAHEFSNLLTTVLGSLELLSLRKREARDERLIEGAMQAARRGQQLTAQLMAFCRKQRLLPVPSDLNALITGVVSLLPGTLCPSVRLEARLDPDLWPVMVDPNQLEAALLNLALNARDAMPKGGVLRFITANVTVDEDGSAGAGPAGDYVSLTVEDTGAGMAPEAAALEPAPEEPGKEPGPGLVQVRDLARQSGGDLHLVSRQGEGAAVTLLLPRAQMLASGSTGASSGPGGGLRILLVDDEADVREVTREVLVEAGYDVLTAPDGQTALALLAREGESIGLLIADYAMPGMNGIDLIQEARMMLPHLEVMLVTGYAEFGNGGELDVIEPLRVLRKPFRAPELLRRIEQVMKLAWEGSGAQAADPTSAV